MSTAADRAAERHAAGFNCAQAVLAAFAGEGFPPEMALRLAAPLGGGMGRSGEVCGALTGALMVLGLRQASGHPEDKERTYEFTRRFIELFRQQHGTILCRDLLGFDVSTPEGLEAARQHGAFGNVCPALVRETARSMEEYLSHQLNG